MKTDLPIMAFTTRDDMRKWLAQNHAISPGIWLRVYKKHSGVPSVSFVEVLEEGLCFGWSESKRIKGNEQSYLQQFTPRRTKGTSSTRNLEYAERLIREGKMTKSGLVALGLG